MSFSSSNDELIDTYSASSMLTTIPCTSIAEPILRNKSRPYGHALPGWIPDLAGDRSPRADLSSPKVTSFETPSNQERSHPSQKAHAVQIRNSSVYMMNYENPSKLNTAHTLVLPNRTAPLDPINESRANETKSKAFMPLKAIPRELKTPINFVQKVKTPEFRLPDILVPTDPSPCGFAVPIQARPSLTSVTTNSERGDTHIFTRSIPIYTLRANAIHRATYFKCTYNNAELMERHEKHFAEWVLPNMAPRQPVLHWCVKTGAVTTMNLKTGASADHEVFPPAHLSVKPNSTLNRHKSQRLADPPNSLLYASGSQSTNIDSAAAVATQIYRTEDEWEYQRQIMRNYAPVVPAVSSGSTTSGGSFSDDSTMVADSSMDFIGGHEHPHQAPVDSKYAADYWLSLMTDESTHQHRIAAGRDAVAAASSSSTSTASSFPLELETQPKNASTESVMVGVVDLCDYLLATITTPGQQPSFVSASLSPTDSEDPTPIAASTTGTSASFPILVKRHAC